MELEYHCPHYVWTNDGCEAGLLYSVVWVERTQATHLLKHPLSMRFS